MCIAIFLIEIFCVHICMTDATCQVKGSILAIMISLVQTIYNVDWSNDLIVKPAFLMISTVNLGTLVYKINNLVDGHILIIVFFI